MLFCRILQLIALFSVVFCLSYGAFARDGVNRPAPESDTGKQVKSMVSGQNIMAVTAHPEATRVAYDVLKQGGSAADAAIAAQLVLGLVEPQSSGLGGGGFVLYYDAKNKQLVTIDGREMAPQTAGKHLFMDQRDGKPMNFYDAAIGGRAVGVPGLLRMMEKLHGWYGKTEWSDLFQPAIKISEHGFTVTPRLNKLLDRERNRFEADIKSKLYFYPDAVMPIAVGETLSNTKYAQTLRVLAREGADYFYKDKMAQDIVAKVKDVEDNRGLLSVEDMASYEAIERKAVCGNYRRYKVCSMGQPSSGGLTLLMMLGMLENFDLRSLGAKDPRSWHIIAEASRLAFADRNKYIADPDYVVTPDMLLANPDYLKKRAALIDIDKAMTEVSAGVPAVWKPKMVIGSDNSEKPPGTTHISIVDAEGNIVSMTSSIEHAFGSRLMTNGFLLNNQLTDFSFVPYDDEGNLVANNVEGGKRPRSSMTPTIVFDEDGKPVLVIGSAGGSHIIGYVAQRIIALIDWDMDIQSALDMPNIVHRGRKFEVEMSAMDMAGPLKNFGHPIEVRPLNSGLTAIHIHGDVMYGAADPRREGVAMGE